MTMSSAPPSAPPNGPLAPFAVQKAGPQDVLDILEFLFSDFLLNEPLNAAVGLTRDECANFFSELVQMSLVDGLSYVVRDPTCGHRLVAVRLACIQHRDPPSPEGMANGQNGTAAKENGAGKVQQKQRRESTGQAFREDRMDNPKVHQISQILHQLEAKIWSLVPAEVDSLLYWLIISVSSKYQRRGIAQALMTHRLDEAVAMGCQGAVTEASALNSQKLFAKLGYRRLFELLHADFKDDQGKPVFRCPDGTDRVTLEFKQF